MSHPSSVEFGTAVLRIGLGAMWIAHALLKWHVYTLPGTAQFFESVGFPGWTAYPVFTMECIGGLMLVIGIYARQVSLALLPVLLGATWAHHANGWVFTSKDGGWEYPAFLAVASFAVWLLGDGAFSLMRSQRFAPISSAPQRKSIPKASGGQDEVSTVQYR